MDYKKVFDNVKELHKFNFTEVIKHKAYSEKYEPYSIFNARNQPEKGNYSFDISGCCHKCESYKSNKEINKPDKNKLEKNKKTVEYKDYKLCYVSHGSHSFDFLNAASVNIKNDCVDWNETPVLFLMENPSKDNKDDSFYGEFTIKEPGAEFVKYPTNTWYWIHNTKRQINDMQNDFESYLKQGYYGEMVYALICKYRLANAYLTNVIKCGMNKRADKEDGSFEDGYIGTWWYYDDCKKTCIINVLRHEILKLTKGYEKLVVFAFGNNAYWLAKDFLSNTRENEIKNLKKQLVLLPHPANYHINDMYRKYLLKDIVNETLNNDSIFTIKSSKLKKCNNSDDIKVFFDKQYQENVDKIRFGKQANENQVYFKCDEESSLFSDKKIIKSVTIRGRRGDKSDPLFDNKGYGYNFVEQEFWAYDYKNKCDIPIENVPHHDLFVKAIEEINDN